MAWRFLISDISNALFSRLEHYFLTHKTMPGEEDQVQIAGIYGHDHVVGVVAAAMRDYDEHYGG